MTCRNDYFKNSFIPYVVGECNKLRTEIRNSTSCQEFRKSMLCFIKPTSFSLFSIHYPFCVKLLVRLRLVFSICMKINSAKTFMILCIHFVLATLSLKQFHTTFCVLTASLHSFGSFE